jgi:hypothetical protein
MKKKGILAKFLVFSVALCAIPFASDSFQQRMYASVPKTLKPLFEQRKIAKIQDAGELFADLNLQQSQLFMWQLKQQFSAAEVDYILTHSKESQWISCINTMAKRVQLAKIIKMYHAFQIGKLAEGDSRYSILLITARDNQKLAEEMRPKEDMVFIINTKGAIVPTR